jgi:tetratricopeptide (TPR) repeat protein
LKIDRKKSLGLPIRLCLLAVLWILGTSKVFAEVEIDLDEASKPAPSPVVKLTPTPANASHKMPVETPTPVPPKEVVPVQQPTDTPVPEVTPAEEKEEVDVEEPTTDSEIVSGRVRMKNAYEAGIKYYQEKDYDQAIRYFKRAVSMKDKYTPKYYYAEAYAMMGVIYQFRIIRYQTAYNYYKQALNYEPRNKTAKKHIKEVAKHLHKR